MRITPAGLLGLGTTSPQELLEIRKDAAGVDAVGVLLHNQNSGANTAIGITFSPNTGGATRAAGIYGVNETTAQNATALTFRTNADSASGIERMRITSAGRVGIGTTSPATTLDVNGDVTITDKIIHGGDTNTAIRFPAADTVSVETAGSERARIDSSGRLLVGTSSARANFTSGARTSPFQVEGTTLNDSALSILRNSNDTGQSGIYLAKSRSTTVGDATPDIVADGDSLGSIFFQGADNTNFVSSASITAQVDGTPGANDMPGRLVFSTTADTAASPTEAVRINSSQQLLVGTTASLASFNDGRLEVLSKASQLAIVADATASSAIGIGIRGNTSTTAVSFFNASDAATCGTIVLNSGSTSYNTSSDYRLKENVAEVTDGITRLQQLKPSRFNFIADPNKTVDGFIAHEVQDIVPEAITGDKDAVDDEGNPVYQGIDQSKLVPLLTAALQEAIAKIETLEARLTAAGIE
jgi:hypothetical protein